jgi:hypothetical protein
MKISRQELEYLIEQEIDEIFGFGGPATKEYPASEMAAITATIFSLAKNAGVQTSPDERDEIVNEIERLLKDEGWRLHEQNLILGDELALKIDNAPNLRTLINDIEAKIPGALNTIRNAFVRGGIQTDLPSSSPPKEEPEDDEDLTDTEVDLPPVDVPEEEPEEEDTTDTEVDLPPVDVPEEEVWDPDDPEIAGGVPDEDDVLVPPDEEPEEEEPEEEPFAPLPGGEWTDTPLRSILDPGDTMRTLGYEDILVALENVEDSNGKPLKKDSMWFISGLSSDNWRVREVDIERLDADYGRTGTRRHFKEEDYATLFDSFEPDPDGEVLHREHLVERSLTRMKVLAGIK